MKTNLYCLVYKNHNARMTRVPYQGIVYSSLNQAKSDAESFSKETKKNMRTARIKLELV